MYLIPRLIGVGIYALLLIIVYYLIPRTKRWSIPLNIYTIALALMGFFYVPMDTALSFKVEVMMYCSLPDSLRIGYFFYY